VRQGGGGITKKARKGGVLSGPDHPEKKSTGELHGLKNGEEKKKISREGIGQK